MIHLLLHTALAQDVVVLPDSAAADLRVDGRLDEAAWDDAPVARTFSRFQPADGGRPDEQIEVRFLQDAQALYVGVRVSGAAAPIRARTSPREAVDSDDQIGVYLDPFGEARQGFIFYLNPLGVQQDLRYDGGSWDVTWDTILRSAGRVTEDGHGFELELAIPFRSLRYPTGGGPQDWRVMITRKVPSEGAKYGWPVMRRGHPRIFQQAATLRGVRPPARGSRVDLIPGLAARVEQAPGGPGSAAAGPAVTSGTPAEPPPLRWSDAKPVTEVLRPFLDVRVGLTASTTLVGTVNPDFSQVESDITPVVLNRRFAFRFPEQRPFFTEGAADYADKADGFYTRRIVEPIAGLKLTGREGAWSFGLMHAIDRAPQGTLHERGTPGFGADETEGRWSLSTVIRVRRDLPHNGQIGMTWLDHRLVGAGLQPEPLGSIARGSADNLTIDWVQPIGERWTWAAWHDQSLAGSAVERLGGTGTGVSLDRARGRGVGVHLRSAFTSKDYRQELGFRPQSGVFEADALVDWTIAGRGVLSTFTPRAQATVYEEVSGEHFTTARLGAAALFDGIHLLDLSAAWTDRLEGDSQPARVQGWSVDLDYEGQIGAVVEWSPTVALAREMDFRDLTPTLRLTTQLQASLRPVRPLRIDLLGRLHRFDRDEPLRGVDITTDTLVRGRVSWQLSRAWGLRLISAWNRYGTTPPTLESSVLLTWLLHPLTAVYVGYAERDRVGRDTATLERSIFVKAHIGWRP